MLSANRAELIDLLIQVHNEFSVRIYILLEGKTDIESSVGTNQFQ